MNFSAVSQIERVLSTQIQKVLLINNGANSIYVLFWSSAPTMILFSIAEPFSKGKQTPIWQNEKKGALYGQKTSFSNPTWMPWQYSLFGTLTSGK